MAREFPCPSCGADILVAYLDVGDICLCRSCYSKCPVPESATITNKTSNLLSGPLSSAKLESDHPAPVPVAEPLPHQAQVNRLYRLVQIGFAQIILLIIIGSFQSGVVQVMGNHYFSLGNRTVEIGAKRGTQLITAPEEVKAFMGGSDQYLFVIIPNSNSAEFDYVSAQHLIIDDMSELEMILELWKEDTSITVSKHTLRKSTLTLWYEYIDFDIGDTTYATARYQTCYPYYLYVQAFWSGERQTPEIVEGILKSIKVTR